MVIPGPGREDVDVGQSAFGPCRVCSAGRRLQRSDAWARDGRYYLSLPEFTFRHVTCRPGSSTAYGGLRLALGTVGKDAGSGDG